MIATENTTEQGRVYLCKDETEVDYVLKTMLDLAGDGNSPDYVKKQALRYCKDKRISALSISRAQGMTLIALLLVGKKSKGTLKNGYAFSYVWNCDCESFSELGDIYIEKRGDNFYRVG